jgi:hypothetical protein
MKMRGLLLLTGAVLLSTAPTLWADQAPYAAPLEAGQRVEITLARPYRTVEGVRVQATSMRLADKDLLTLVAGGQEKTLPQLAGRGHVQGVLTAVDDAWLTLDLGEKQPLLRIPRVAVVRWETLGLAAQGSGPLPTGQRVRVVSREAELGGQLLAGRLLAIDDETLLLKVDDRAEPIRLRRASIGQIEVSRGKRSGAGKGALIGGVAIGIPAAAFGLLRAAIGACFMCEGPGPHPEPDYLAGGTVGFVLGAAIGGAIGAAIGSASNSERWERVPLSLAVAPQRRGVRAALTLRF